MITREREREFGDLPILEQIGEDLSIAFAREERAVATRVRRRRVRRLVAAAAAAFVLVPAAVATREVWLPAMPKGSGQAPPLFDRRPIQVAEGSFEGTHWRIGAYMSADGPCHQFTLFTDTESYGTGSGLCRGKLPPEWEIGMGTSGGPTGTPTFVEGFVSPRVARVEVLVNGKRQPVEIAGPPRAIAERAGLPLDLRFYVAGFRGDLMAEGTALRVVAFDSAGVEIDRREIDFSPARPSR